MEIFSPAKINLFLHVTGKRPDGYHNLFMLMCCITLYDTISMTFGVEKISVSCTDPDVPQDETNLAHRAASLFFKTLNKYEGVKISIEKKIPTAAGLGGGSSNAAAVLDGLNRHYGYPFSRDALMSMGLSLGADVPFFIFRKPAIATGIGEQLEVYEGLKPFEILLVFPGFGVSTEDVYKKFQFRIDKMQKKIIEPSIKDNDFDAAFMCNDLEAVTVSKYPDIKRIKNLLLNQGAEGALMSGSGPSVFGLFSDPECAEKAKQALSSNSRWSVYIADMII